MNFKKCFNKSLLTCLCMYDTILVCGSSNFVTDFKRIRMSHKGRVWTLHFCRVKRQCLIIIKCCIVVFATLQLIPTLFSSGIINSQESVLRGGGSCISVITSWNFPAIRLPSLGGRAVWDLGRIPFCLFSIKGFPRVFLLNYDSSSFKICVLLWCKHIAIFNFTALKL